MTKDVTARIRISERLADWSTDLATRSMAPPGAGLRVAAELLAGLLDAELTGMVWRLGEATLMAEAAGQVLLSVGVGRGVLAAGLADLTRGIERSFVDRHDLDDVDDIRGLISTLRDLTPGQDLALRDALSRWWAGDQADGAQGFLDVGIRVV